MSTANKLLEKETPQDASSAERIELARKLGSTLKSVLPGLAGAFLLQGIFTLITLRESPEAPKLILLNLLVAAIAWVGSMDTTRGSIPVSVENLATAIVALTVAVEILHVWFLHEISFTIPLIAAQYAAGLVLWRAVVFWPVLIGSLGGWLAVVVQQEPPMDWVPLAVCSAFVCWKASGLSRLQVSEILSRLRTERLEAERKAKEVRERAERDERERRERTAILAAGDGHWFWDLTTDKCHYSKSWAGLFGFTQDEIGDRPDEFFNRVHAHYLPQVKEDLSAHIYGKLPTLQSQFRMQCRDGGYIWVLLRGAVETDEDGNPVSVSGSLVDVTHMVQAEKAIIDDAFQDRLTGLPNRKALTVRLERAVDQMNKSPSLFALIFLDLDRFKIINDSQGHLVGDQLLAAAASRLRGCLRQRTGDIIARFGGDEFVALLEDLSTAEDVIVIAERFLNVLRQPFKIGSHELTSGGSIGIAFNNSSIKTAEDLMRHADTAMYQAKAEGKGRFKIFNDEMHEAASRAHSLENDLSHALSRDQLFLVYQPVVSMTSGEIVGAEALVRWRRSPSDVVAPAEFIALAEETGSIATIGEWVLRQAVEQNARWQRLRLPQLRVAVNVSAKQLQSPGFPELVVSILEESQLDPNWLELELTETALMANLNESATAIEALRNAGVRVSIDDFGTGYSSLGYLRRFSFSCLKMDRSFIAAMTEDEKSLAVARGLIALAHNLCLGVTAEGVESTEQLQILRRYGCDQFQGYLASRPVTADDFRNLLEKGPMISLLSAPSTSELAPAG